MAPRLQTRARRHLELQAKDANGIRAKNESRVIGAGRQSNYVRCVSIDEWIIRTEKNLPRSNSIERKYKCLWSAHKQQGRQAVWYAQRP